MEKSAAEKLMIKSGRRVRFANPPANLIALLGALPEGAVVIDQTAEAGDVAQTDVMVLFANNSTDLTTLLPGLRTAIAPGGIIWVAYHKGTSTVKTDINRDSINAYAHTIGLQGVAMISIDDDWSALRLKVIEQPA